MSDAGRDISSAYVVGMFTGVWLGFVHEMARQGAPLFDWLFLVGSFAAVYATWLSLRRRVRP